MDQSLESLFDILVRQTALLGRLAAAQEIVRNAVLARDWADMEALFDRLMAYGDEFEKLEGERLQLFDRFGRNRPESIIFYSMTARLPAPQRQKLTALYRGLKLGILKVRLTNEALAAYLEGARSLLGDFLSVAFPERQGKLYSRRGAAVAAEMSSLLVNRSF